MRALIDSDVLVDYLRGRSEAADELARYAERCISLISWMEVMVGAGEDAAEEGACRRFLESFRVLPVSRAVAERAVSLRRKYRLKLPDAIIWASAQEEACLLVTRNTRDFRLTTQVYAFPTEDKVAAPNESKLSDRGWRGHTGIAQKSRPPASVRWSALLGVRPSSEDGLPAAQEIFERRADILDDLAQDHGRHISAGMVRNGGAASIGMPILHVRATLPGQDETQGVEDAAHLTGLEDGRPWHGLRGDGDTLRADELRVQIRLPILQQHLNDLAEVAL